MKKKKLNYNVQVCNVKEDVEILGHIFQGLGEILDSVEKTISESGYMLSDDDDYVKLPDVHVGEIWESYPCFDEYDEMYECRAYYNFIFRSDNITEDDLRKARAVIPHGNYKRIHENTPLSILPMVYYEGEGDYMLVATPK